MKTKHILAILMLAVLGACKSGTNRSFIAGIYVNEGGGKYSVASDTLTIEQSEGNNFIIHRKTGFNLIRDGKKGKREHETEIWTAIYDEQTGSLHEIQNGKILTFYPKAGKLKVGSREYIKLETK